MKNIPMFTTDAGVASLILEEIPYRNEAYIRIYSATDPEKLIEEAVSFCRTVGADTVFATADVFLEQYPVHTEIFLMQCEKRRIPAGTAQLHLMTEATLQQWCEIYNAHMKNIPNASTITHSKARKLLEENNCYFVHDNGVDLGIGKISENGVDAIVSLVPGRGGDVMLALCGAVHSDMVSVEVAFNNAPAIKLYERLGFVRKQIISKWFCVSRKNT